MSQFCDRVVTLVYVCILCGKERIKIMFSAFKLFKNFFFLFFLISGLPPFATNTLRKAAIKLINVAFNHCVYLMIATFVNKQTNCRKMLLIADLLKFFII